MINSKGEDLDICEYCDNKTNKAIFLYGVRGDFFIYQNGRLLTVEYDVNLYDDTITDKIDININYCPMCGRELKGV